MSSSEFIPAVLGIGLMGAPMAKHLINGGYKIYIWNRSQDKALALQAQFGQEKVHVAETPDQAITAANTIIICLFDGSSILQVFEKLSKQDIEGKTFIVTSTIAVSESKQFYQMITEKGGSYIEAPVLGNSKVAESAKLQILVGSSHELFEKYSPLLKHFGTPKYIGENGKGLTVKLAQNQMLASLLATFSSSLALIEREGVPVETFMDILVNGPFGNGYHPIWKEKMTKQKYSDVAFKLAGIKKDVDLFIQLTKELGMDSPFINGLGSFLATAESNVDPNLDMSAVYETSKYKKK